MSCFTPRADQIDHDLDHLHPNLRLRDVVQDLYSTGSTQEICAIIARADYTALTRQHELDHADRTD